MGCAGVGGPFEHQFRTARATMRERVQRCVNACNDAVRPRSDERASLCPAMLERSLRRRDFAAPVPD
eukprot:6190616-Pleurochrysis_carterae.AAC.2